MKHVIIGTAGHIDHGKSALVMALTGTDPDRLGEEKRRGITIDLGFAHLDLGNGVRAAFIDVPGHERFVKNMLAGATGIDAVLLVVAADESIKPQTHEHFEICKLLGVGRGIVALTKADLVDRDIVELVRLEVQEFVVGSFLEGAPIIAVSARTGEGLDALKSALRRLSVETAPKPQELPFRLPIDRAFVMKGFGCVVTGTLIAGKIQRDCEVQIYPGGRCARVRGIEAHNQPQSVAVAGQRAALNLAGIEVKDVHRGMMLALPDELRVTARMDCSLRLLPSARSLKNRAKVHFHCWAAETLADVILLEGKELKPGMRAYAQLRLAEAGVYLSGDRFIIRQFSPVVTLGGGTVLDNFPARRRASDPEARASLERLEMGGPEARVELPLQACGEASILSLVARTGWHADEVLKVARQLEARKKLRVLGQPPSRLVHSDAARDLSQALLQILGQFHDNNPLAYGMSKEALHGQARLGSVSASAAASQLLFDASLQELASAGKIDIEDQTLRLAGRGVTLNAEELGAKQEITRAFETAGLCVPPSIEVLASLRIDRARAEKILQILMKEKVLHKVAEGLIFHQSALEHLRQALREQKQKSGRLSVPTFKELTGVSRKYAIPLLEYLDRERVTRRSGDERIIL